MNTQHAASIRLVTITPDMAGVLLLRNAKNRPLNDSAVSVYADALKRGEWRVNGETIKFSTSGRLLDGQHRLKAIVVSGVPLTTYIAENLAEEVFDTLDQGKRRSAADVLTMAGEKDAARLGAAARAYLMLTHQATNKSRVTAAQCAQLLRDVPQLRYWVAVYAARPTLTKLIPSCIAAVAALVAEKHGQETVEKFLDQVNSGIGLVQGDPALLLREKFINREVGRQFKLDYTMALCIKAFNAYTQKRKIAILRLKADESFPEVA